MRDKRRMALLIGGGLCLLLILIGVVIDLVSGGWSNSLIFGILGLVVGSGIIVVGLRQGGRS